MYNVGILLQVRNCVCKLQIWVYDITLRQTHTGNFTMEGTVEYHCTLETIHLTVISISVSEVCNEKSGQLPKLIG